METTEGAAGRHGWFGPDGRALAGWLHSPGGPPASTTGVVLCPPLGIEGVASHRTYRELAETLALRGLTALRFDYAGTGDSWDPAADADQTPEWLASIGHAVALLRDSGASRVELVGMRSGALLAAAAVAAGLPVDGLVLWDPHVSGKRMLRQEQALLRLNIGGHEMRPTTDGSVAGPGFVYSPSTAAHVRALTIDLEQLAALCPEIDLVVRSDVPGDPALLATAERVAIRVHEVGDQAPLIDVPAPFAAVPQRSVELVASSLAGRAGAFVDALPAVQLAGESRGTGPAGRTRLVERSTHLGPQRVFAVITEPEGDIAGTVVLAPTAYAHHIGSGRSWVELARLGAERGLRVVRLDQDDAGDSPRATSVDGPVYYHDASADDIVDAVRALDLEPQQTALVGLCAGGWSACRAAAVVEPRALVVINQWIWTVRAEPLRTSVDTPTVTMNTRIGWRLQNRPGLLRLATRTNALVRRLTPESLTRSRTAHRRRNEPHLLLPLLESGIEIDMLNCTKEADRFRRHQSAKELRALSAAPGFHEFEDPAWEHSLFTRQSLDEVLPMVADRLVARFAPSGDLGGDLDDPRPVEV